MAKIKRRKVDRETHFVDGNADMAICGCDILEAKSTSNPVNCWDCLELVRFCRALKLKTEESANG